MVKVFAFVFLLTLTVAGQSGSCPECPDPSRPWMRGSVEMACARDGHTMDGDETPTWHACACQHQCDPTDERADETGARKWDAACKARCKPSHCHCPHPCGEGA